MCFDLSIEKIRTMEGPKLNRYVTLFNVLLGLLYVAVGISFFFLSALSLSLSTVVLAISLIVFGIILISYHVHVSLIEDWMYNNFGFMYDWKGRGFYLLFNGFMCFSFNTFGYITGALTLLVLIFNVIALRLNNDLKALVVREDHDFLAKHVGEANSGNGAKFDANLASWEEVVDPESGKKYYYNSSTGETSWTLPGQ